MVKMRARSVQLDICAPLLAKINFVSNCYYNVYVNISSFYCRNCWHFLRHNAAKAGHPNGAEIEISQRII